MEASIAQSGQEASSISFDLPVSEAAVLKELADIRGGSVAAAIRQALINDKFVRDQIKAGRQILIQNPDGQLIKLNWA
jgi:hypothetical protein